MRADRVAQSRAQLVRERPAALAPHVSGRHRRRPREPPHLDAAVLRHEQVPGGQLAHVAVDRHRGWDAVEREVRLERLEVDLAGESRLAHERLELRRERQDAARDPVVERLDPERIAGQDEAARPGVPQRDREHAAQPGGEVEAALLVEVRQHLRVAVRREPVPAPRQVVLQPAVLVELAVLDDRTAPSSLCIGWSPRARSMIARRRAARPTGPETNTPSLSGPRCASARAMARTVRSSAAPPARASVPQMPHTAYADPSRRIAATSAAPRCSTRHAVAMIRLR